MYFITRVPDGVIGNTTGFGPVILGSSPNEITFRSQVCTVEMQEGAFAPSFYIMLLLSSIHLLGIDPKL